MAANGLRLLGETARQIRGVLGHRRFLKQNGPAIAGGPKGWRSALLGRERRGRGRGRLSRWRLGCARFGRDGFIFRPLLRIDHGRFAVGRRRLFDGLVHGRFNDRRLGCARQSAARRAQRFGQPTGSGKQRLGLLAISPFFRCSVRWAARSPLAKRGKDNLAGESGVAPQDDL